MYIYHVLFVALIYHGIVSKKIAIAVSKKIAIELGYFF
jgi:hypothetical protein